MNINEFHAITPFEKDHIKTKILKTCRLFMKDNSFTVSVQKTYKALEYNQKVVKHCIYTDKEFMNEKQEIFKKTCADRKTTFITKASLA